ncbi:MAG: cell division protein ZapE [Alphaproteobacteria bacterium]
MQRYHAALAQDALIYDPAQEEAARRLDALHGALRGYRPPEQRSGLLRFGGRTEPVRGLYICGAAGRGKSMLMDLFFETAPLTAKRRVHFHAFMQEIHEAIAGWRRLGDRERRRRLRELGLPRSTGDDPIPPVARQVSRDVTLLAFDEFQVNDVADAMLLGRLFEALFEDGIVVVATSNTPPDDLYRDGLNRQLFLPFIELLKARMDVFHLDSPNDYRLGRLNGREVYFTPLGPKADRAMNRAWRELTGGEAGTPCTISLKGRTLHVPLMANRMARFSFADLFEKPLGAADYLRLAELFRAVFVDGVPKMDPGMRNEARRFITFVDALYEKRRRLVMSADVPPIELYAEGDGSADFSRAASRLAEMQSAGYGAAENPA